VSRPRSRSIAKGVVAGLIGGILATAARNAVERVYPPRKAEPGEPETRTVGRLELTTRRPSPANPGMHWALGAAAGAAYGAVAEFYPPATARQGANFGMALIALNEDNILPAIGFGEKKAQGRRERTSEMISYVTYGVITETVRSVVRRMIA